MLNSNPLQHIHTIIVVMTKGRNRAHVFTKAKLGEKNQPVLQYPTTYEALLHCLKWKTCTESNLAM